MSRRYWKSEENTRPVARLGFFWGCGRRGFRGAGGPPLASKKKRTERERERKTKKEWGNARCGPLTTPSVLF